MNDKVKELTERVRLTPEEIDNAFDNAFDKPIEFDHKPTPEEIIAIRLKAVAQTQLNKVLKEDLALIVRKTSGFLEEYPATHEILGYVPLREELGGKQ